MVITKMVYAVAFQDGKVSNVNYVPMSAKLQTAMVTENVSMVCAFVQEGLLEKIARKVSKKVPLQIKIISN